jgi:hypothetical protein
MSESGITIREYDGTRRGERGFVISTWHRSYGHTRAGVDRSVYGAEQGDLVERILDADHTRTVVACSGKNDDTLHAWACGRPPALLHYAYVPPELRRDGLATRLIAHLLGGVREQIDATHQWPFLGPRFRFNPYPLTRLEAS